MQGIYDIAEILAQNKFFDVVLSPGSRCAPITNSVTQHPKLNCYSVIDERSAAFYAIGMSLATKKSSTLICTSGSAGLNYAPAVAEAFFQEIPLLILTADRPKELIDQYDGQTIFQENLFGKNVKASFNTPEDYNKQEIHQIVHDAIQLANTLPYGPVHINIPLKEPLYNPEKIQFTQKELKVEINKARKSTYNKALIKEIESAKQPLIIIGQGIIDLELSKFLSKLQIPILKDVHSNSSIGLTEGDSLNYNVLTSPDLIITINKSLISKKLKLYLRDLKELKHVHIGTDRINPNTFGALIGKITDEPLNVLKEINFISTPLFFKEWSTANKEIVSTKINFFTTLKNTEIDFYNVLLKSVPSNYSLHFANSMAIRYGNILQQTLKKTIEIQCNRGTSGIDGSTSTAAGFSLKKHNPNILFTGDLSFFYDRNAFWNNHFPKNLKIIVFNNEGGGIFNMIPGPNLHSESKEYFTTPISHSAKNLAKEFKIDYLECSNIKNIDEIASQFFKVENTAILEIKTKQAINTSRLKELKKALSN